MKHTHYTKGNTLIVLVVFLLAITVSLVMNVSSISLGGASRVNSWTASHQTLSDAESATEDVTVRLKNRINVPDSGTVRVGSTYVPITLRSLTGMAKQIVATGTVGEAQRTLAAQVDVGAAEGGLFAYATQAGAGGITTSGSVVLNGAIISNGPIVMGGGSTINGNATSTGPNGLININNSSTVTGSVRAHKIQSGIINNDAYYQILATGVTVKGSKNPGYPDAELEPMYITDSDIAELEAQAEAGGISTKCVSGKYTITTPTTLSGQKIPCTLEIQGGQTTTIAGNVWVVGDIILNGSVTLKMAPALKGGTVSFIADNPANQVTSSKLTIGGGDIFVNSGTTGSYIAMISMNRSAEQGGNVNAATVNGSATGAFVVYAPHGLVPLSGSTGVCSVTAYKMTIGGGSVITWCNTLKNAYLVDGTGATFQVTGWREIE